VKLPITTPMAAVLTKWHRVRYKSRTLVPIVGVLLLLLAGCGGGGTPRTSAEEIQKPRTSEEKVRSVYKDFLSAFAASDYKKACSLSTREALARDKQYGGCEGAFRYVESQLGERNLEAFRNTARRLGIKSVKLGGNKAVVTDSKDRDAILYKESGKWLVDNLGWLGQ
jgi:hypothetical protein